MTQNEMEYTKIENYYNDYASFYEQERREGYYSSINSLEFGKIKQYAQGAKTLEVGCGTGLILERTHKVAEKAIGIDISDGMLEVCRNKGLNVQKASAIKLPFEDDAFDLVYSFKVLAHIPEIEKAIHEMARVLKPDGRMVLEFYNPISFKGLNSKLRDTIKRGNPVFIRYDRPKDIRRYLPDKARVISVRGVRIWGPFAACYTFPIISRVFKYLDRLTCESFWKVFGGYYIVEVVFKEEINCSFSQ